ncbi:hypothetical protein C8Q76DRAFT_628275, partial [Earliella scabrosa]
MPDLVSVSDSESEPGSDVGNANEFEHGEPIPSDLPQFLDDFFIGSDRAHVAQDPFITDEEVLFDSGATRHMSPYRHRFINYTAIPVKSIHAADQHIFKAVGKGDMYIDLPNGD